jgi:hypothetical protein
MSFGTYGLQVKSMLRYSESVSSTKNFGSFPDRINVPRGPWQFEIRGLLTPQRKNVCGEKEEQETIQKSNEKPTVPTHYSKVTLFITRPFQRFQLCEDWSVGTRCFGTTKGRRQKEKYLYIISKT